MKRALTNQGPLASVVGWAEHNYTNETLTRHKKNKVVIYLLPVVLPVFERAVQSLIRKTSVHDHLATNSEQKNLFPTKLQSIQKAPAPHLLRDKAFKRLSN